MSQGTLSDNARSKITADIDKNDQSVAQVRAVCYILKDVIDKPLDESQDFLIEMLPVAMLYSDECLVDYRIFNVIRALLVELGVTIRGERGTLIPIKVAKSLYTDEEDVEEAEKLVKDFHQRKKGGGSPRPPTSTQHIVTTTGNDSILNLGRNKANVSSSFSDKDKFSGSISGNVPLHRIRIRFMDAIRDQSIPRGDEVELLHCCLSGMALDFYYKSIRGICSTTDEAFASLEAQFNSFQHQAQARTYLKSLTLRGVMKEKDCSMLQALETAHNRITETAPNCGKEYQHQAHYCDYLKHVVEGHSWAEPVIQERLTPTSKDGLDYNSFYAKLCGALSRFELSNPTDSAERSSNLVGSAPTFYGERYAASPIRKRNDSANGYRSPSVSSRLNIHSMIRPPNRIKRRMTPSQLAQIKAKTRCLRCNKIGHWRQECPNSHSRSMKEVLLSIVAQLGNGDEAVAQTLWAISEDDDEYAAYTVNCAEGADTVTNAQTTTEPNSFSAFVNAMQPEAPYTDQDAEQDLQDYFKDLFNFWEAGGPLEGYPSAHEQSSSPDQPSNNEGDATDDISDLVHSDDESDTDTDSDLDIGDGYDVIGSGDQVDSHKTKLSARKNDLMDKSVCQSKPVIEQPAPCPESRATLNGDMGPTSDSTNKAGQGNRAKPIRLNRRARRLLLRKLSKKKVRFKTQKHHSTCLMSLPAKQSGHRHPKTRHLQKCFPLAAHRYCMPRHLRRRIKHIYYVPRELKDLELPSASKTYNSDDEQKFEGGCMGIGAQRAVIGLPQARAYCESVGIELKTSPSRNSFRFGVGVSKSIGKIPIVIPTPENLITLWVDVVPHDIPFLIGLDVLDRFSLQVLSVYNQLECVREGWKVPLQRKLGHIYWTWDNSIATFYNKAQLQRLHRHLLHPSARKLYNLLRRANPEQMSKDTMDTLKDIQKTCEACQLYSPNQFVFRIRDTDNIRFNHLICLDIMYSDPPDVGKRTSKKKPILHIVDVGTKFQAAAFLPKVDTTTIWNTFVKMWSSIYVGFPECMLTDQGSVFMSKEWEFNCALAKIDLKHTGTESHNSLGSGETYHALLRRVYKKTTLDHPTVPDDVRLSMSIKAINSTVGPDGLCPQLLVFGVPPQIPSICPNEYPAQRERLQAMEKARREYERLVSKELVNRGIRSIPPPAADHKYMPGDFVYVYREGVKHYTGPHLVASVDGKQLRLHMGENTGPRAFNISQVRPAPLSRLESMDELLTRDNIGSERVLYTEVLSPQDPRGDDPRFYEAMRKEMIGLIEKGTFRVVLAEELGDNPNIIPTRFVLSIKHAETGEVKFKARFVLGGHRDKAKNSIVHSSVNLKQSSIRLLMALATILGFDVWSLDVKQAYLQSGSNLKRKIFVKPHELDLKPEEFLQVILPLYGLSDSGDYWCETFARFHIHDLRMQQATGDFALFFRRLADQVVALSGCYVDDVLPASKPSMKAAVQRQIQNKFDLTLSDAAKFVYTGILCDTSNRKLRTLSQAHYIKRLQYLPNSANFEEYRSLRAKLMWVVHTRPDIACASSMAAQVTAKTFTVEAVIMVSRVLKHLKNSLNLILQYPKLDQTSLKLVVYTDSSFANLPDHKSQLGFIVCLCDSSGRCSILHYSFHNSHRVAHSSMAAETLAFVDGFDNAYLIRHDLERILGQHIPLLMFTDSKLMFDVLTRSRYTTERRLMVDIASAREAYLDGIISNIGLIESRHNPADSLTKIYKANDALQELLKTHKLDHPVSQYVIHSNITM